MMSLYRDKTNQRPRFCRLESLEGRVLKAGDLGTNDASVGGSPQPAGEVVVEASQPSKAGVLSGLLEITGSHENNTPIDPASSASAQELGKISENYVEPGVDDTPVDPQFESSGQHGDWVDWFIQQWQSFNLFGDD